MAFDFFAKVPKLQVPYISHETDRILALERQVDTPDPAYITDLFRSPPGSCKIKTCELCQGTSLMPLRPVQASMLYQLSKARGLFGPVAAGWGKTLPAFLAPALFDCQRPIFVTKADLTPQARDDLKRYWYHWSYPINKNGHFPKPLAPYPEGDGFWMNPNTKAYYHYQGGVPVAFTWNKQANTRGTDPFKAWVPYSAISHMTPQGTLREVGFKPFLILSYDKLSRANKKTGRQTFDLEAYNPDMLIFDEAHSLKDATTSRTMRVSRYLEANPQVIVITLSGNLTTRSIYDYAHLSKWSLGPQKTPLPTNPHDLQAWAQVLDANKTSTAGYKEWDIIDPIRKHFALEEDYLEEETSKEMFDGCDYEKRVGVTRLAFRRNLVTAVGITATAESSLEDVPLVMNLLHVAVPVGVTDAIQVVDRDWTTPDGEEEFSEAPIKAACTRHLSAGFWYRWIIPTEEEALKEFKKWKLARKNWHHEARIVLKQGLRGADSLMLLARHCKRAAGEIELPPSVEDRPVLPELGLWLDDEYADAEDIAPLEDKPEEQEIISFIPPDSLLTAYKAWSLVKHLPQPPTETVWISDFFIQRAKDFLENDSRVKGKPVILWYENLAVEEALSRLTVKMKGKQERLKVYGKGKTPPKTAITCAMSIRVHGVGKNLQKWAHNLMLVLPPNGTTFEQMAARTHRPGQEEKEVNFYYFQHVEPYKDAMGKILYDAKYQHQTMGPQRILSAEWRK